MCNEMNNLYLIQMQDGIEILGKLLTNTLKVTEKGDKYTLLFKKDVDLLVVEALKQARIKAYSSDNERQGE